jgi:hypothetical protein
MCITGCQGNIPSKFTRPLRQAVLKMYTSMRMAGTNIPAAKCDDYITPFPKTVVDKAWLAAGRGLWELERRGGGVILDKYDETSN